MSIINHWKMVTSFCLSTKISVRLTQKGLQVSCHQITGRNDKYLSLEKVYLVLFKYEKFKVVQKGMPVHLPPNNR